MKNMGTADRAIRTAVAIGIGIAYLSGAVSGTPAIVLGIVAIAFLATSIVGMCPVYSLLGISSCYRTKRA